MKPEIKKVILITIAIIAGVLLTTALCWYLYLQGQFNLYQDRQYKYSIQYPKLWKLDKDPKSSVVAMFISPKETKLDTFQENASISVQEVPGHLASLKTFSDTIKNQMTAVFKKDIKIIENMPITFGGRLGHRMVFEMANPVNLKMIILWTIKGDKAYIYNFTCPINKYSQYELLVSQMIKSFQLK